MTASDRFAPPLMHAFRAAFRERDARKTVDQRDADGERIIAGRRGSPRNAVAEAVLRRELSEDLGGLLNTVNLGSAEDILAFPHVARSILNYGLTDLTAVAIDEAGVSGIGAELRTVLVDYEPRLVADTIAIERDPSVEAMDLKVRFRIRAELLATPVDVPVEFIAELDSGKLRISRL